MNLKEIKIIRTFSFMLALLLLMFSANPITASAAPAGTGNYIVRASGVGLNMRSGPGTSYSILKNIPDGQRISITLVSNTYWGKTTYGGSTGYVHLDYAVKESSGSTTKPTLTNLRAYYDGRNKDVWDDRQTGQWEAYQCQGFAVWAKFMTSGKNVSTWTKVYNLNTVRAGDIIRTNEGTYQHSIIITSVNGSSITYAEANTDWKNGIKWSVSTNLSNLQKLKGSKLLYVWR